MRFLRGWARANYEWLTLSPQVETVPIDHLFPENSRLSLEVASSAWGLPLAKLYALLRIARSIEARTIVEIGTYEGSTTLQLASACPESRIVTVDLPGEHEDFTVGSQFAGTTEAERIEQILADSTRYDFSRFHGRVDLVVIDGAHDYRGVRNDSLNALRMVRPGGVIVWDDYTTWLVCDVLLGRSPNFAPSGTCVIPVWP